MHALIRQPRGWLLASAVAAVAMFAVATDTAGAQEPQAETVNANAHLEARATATAQLAMLLESPFFPAQAKVAIAAILARWGYDIDAVTDYARPDRPQREHRPADVCRRVANADAPPADLVERCRDHFGKPDVRPSEVCRRVANADSPPAELLERCRDHFGKPDVRTHDVCDRVRAADEAATQLLRRCVAAHDARSDLRVDAHAALAACRRAAGTDEAPESVIARCRAQLGIDLQLRATDRAGLRLGGGAAVDVRQD